MKQVQYGHLYGQTHALLVNATDLKGALVIYMKRVMKMEENSPVINTDGKFDHKATLQNWHNEYKDVVLENAANDGEVYTSVSIDETACHILNTFGWVTADRVSISNSILLPELIELFNRWGIKE